MVKKLLATIVALMIFPVAVQAEEFVEEAALPDYTILPVEAGDIVPFEGILLSLDAAAKVLAEKRFVDAECDLRLEYELGVQRENFELQLSFKDIELQSSRDKYESMMILKAAENERLYKLVTKTKPGQEPFMVALGFGIGTLTSIGIFALSTEIVRE
tara:strand:- start:146 stop:619 length:474 start_codon:yes stop_codon:yes gene_type:complete